MQRTPPAALESQASRGLAGQLLASLVLGLAVLAAVVTVSFPVATAGLVGTVGLGAVLVRGARSALARRPTGRRQSLCVPGTDVCLHR